MDSDEVAAELKEMVLRWAEYSFVWDFLIILLCLVFWKHVPGESWWVAILNLSPKDIVAQVVTLADRKLYLIIGAALLAWFVKVSFSFIKKTALKYLWTDENLRAVIREKYEKINGEVAGIKAKNEEIELLEKEIEGIGKYQNTYSLVNEALACLALISLAAAINTKNPVDILISAALLIAFFALIAHGLQIFIDKMLGPLVIRAALMGDKRAIPVDGAG